MKKAILLAAIISVFSISATYAQDAPAKEKKEHRARKGGGQHGGDLYKDLNLTKDQKEKIKAINEDQKTKFRALKDDTSLTDDARKKKVMELKKARKEKVNEILTPEQKTKMEAKMKERKKGRGNKEKK